jgi:glycosyltransferase 2 family protein
MKFFSLAIKVGILGLVSWFIATKTNWEELTDAIYRVQPILVFGLVMLVVVQAGLLSLRWSLISRARGYSLSLKYSFQGTLVSFFIAQGLPSSIGGDALRLWWMKRKDIPLKDATVVVLVDRALGFLTLLVLCIASIFILAQIVDSKALDTIVIVVGWAVAMGLLVGTALSLPWRFGISKFLKERIHKLPKFAGVAVQAGLDVRQYFAELSRRPGEFFAIVFLGLAVHSITVFSAYMIALDIDLHVSLWSCFAVVPPALIASYLPISIAGWGVREGVIVAAFSLLSVPTGNALLISILIGLSVLVTSLLGGLIWVSGDIGTAIRSSSVFETSKGGKKG